MDIEIDDATVHIATGGRRFKPGQHTVIFLHGAGVDHTVWVLNTRYFARAGFNVLAPDLPGHGRSGGRPLESIEAMAGWLIALLDSMQIDNCSFVGHSLGTFVALHAASELGQRVRRLVLFGTSYPMPVSQPLLEAAKANRHSAIEMITTWGHGYGTLLGGNPVAGVHVFYAAQRLLERAGQDVIFHDLNACNGYVNGEAAMAKVSCPVSIVTADSDLMTPPQAAKAMQKWLGQVEFEMIEDCGHMMMSEQPEAAHRLLVKALC